MNFGAAMRGDRHCRRIDTIGLKVQIEMRLGRQKTEQYFKLLERYLSVKISKSEFDKLCIGLLGRESVTLHNGLIRAIIRNAHVAKSPPPMHDNGKSSLNVKVPNKYQRSTLQWLGKDRKSPKLWDQKSKNHASPFGTNVTCEDSSFKCQEQQSATELLSLGSRPPVEVTSVEEGEEIEQLSGSPGIHSRSPLTAPFGVYLKAKGKREMLSHGSSPFFDVETCYKNGLLPDTSSLRKRLEQKLETEGLNVSTDSVNLLNNGLDVFMKRLLKPCVDLASSRSESKVPNKVYHEASSYINGVKPQMYMQNSSRWFTVSSTDFQVAMELDPQVLGEDWPVQMCASDNYLNG